MPLTTLQLEHIPASHAVHISVYNNVANARFLHDQLLANNADFEYAFIDACAVGSLACPRPTATKLQVTWEVRVDSIDDPCVGCCTPGGT